MNERIEELSLQCIRYKLISEGARSDFDYKKFAELIVRDCASQIDTFVAMNVPPVLLSSLLRKQYIKDESGKEL